MADMLVLEVRRTTRGENANSQDIRGTCIRGKDIRTIVLTREKFAGVVLRGEYEQGTRCLGKIYLW